MPVSANTLFHYTDTLEKLINILKYEFRPSYCIESSLKNLTKDSSPFKVVWAVPMVCFCDLPLSMVRDHMKIYGHYALGMSKEWGIKSGLNPMMYLCKGSDLSDALNVLDKKIGKQFARIEAYIKPYESMQLLGFPKKRYYDEREWRYVPKPEEGDDFSIQPETYSIKYKLEEANQRIADRYKLSFTPHDIKYIVIKSESERLRIIQATEEAKRKYSPSVVKQLSSRILSSQQIRDDF